jgi:hypothetical protein
VMLTRSGAKLLDFGLAKAEAPLASRGSHTAMPTRAPTSSRLARGSTRWRRAGKPSPGAARPR